MEKVMNVNQIARDAYIGNYCIKGSLDVGKIVILRMSGFVTLDALELNGGLLKIMTPRFVTIGNIHCQSGGSIFIESEDVLCPRIDYPEGLFVSMKNPHFSRWTSVELFDVRGSEVSLSKEGSLEIHRFTNTKVMHYVKR